ncbi:glycosyltransferase [Geomonas agri]|uniref:glycosyltransferase n=1 Tax=Geomonas agri TaxID=2873702 RepID=UPI001CD7012F|nr:glycosyltransferase [Geomonas agri]
MSPFNPRISIVIPVYNGSDFLREAIDSALAQTYRNIEILVVNDGSRDDGKTEAIAVSYGDKIRYFPKQNGGVASALNHGIREMTGAYFSWLSHDDLYYPAKTEEQVRLLETLGRETIIYSDFEYIDSKGNFLGIKKAGAAQSHGIKYSLVMEGSINGCTVMIPRQCFDKVGLFDESLRTTQDFDMWFRLAAQFPFCHQPLHLVKSRVHPNQGSLTIPGHQVEQDDLYCNAISTFCDKDLPPGQRGAMASFYIKAAIRFTSIGCDKAAVLARERFRSCWLKDSPGRIAANSALAAEHAVLRLLYRNEVAKKAVKKLNRLLSGLR